jgi:hypothetical protein
MLWTVRERTVDVDDHENSSVPIMGIPHLGRARCFVRAGDGSDSVLASAAASVIVRCVGDQELMRLSNHHASLAPVIEERPGRYLRYFENKFGERWCSCTTTVSLTPRCCSAMSAGSRVASATQAGCRMRET